EIPAQTWRPLGLAFLYTGGALIGTLGLESGSLGASSKRELGVVGAAALVTGFVMTLRRPAPRPAEGNILYNRLLTEQIARRNADIAKENVARRQQVQLTIEPSLKTGARDVGGRGQGDQAGSLGRLRSRAALERRGRHPRTNRSRRVRRAVARCVAGRRALDVRPGSRRDRLVPSRLYRGTEVLRGR